MNVASGASAMSDGKPSAEREFLFAIPVLIILALLILVRLFGDGPSARNQAEMAARLDRAEAHDAEDRGDLDAAEWWDRQAKKDAHP